MSTCSYLFKVDHGKALDLGYKIMVWNQVFEYETCFRISERAKDAHDLAVLIGAGFERHSSQTPEQFESWCYRNARTIWDWAGTSRLVFHNEYSDLIWDPGQIRSIVPDATFIEGRYDTSVELYDLVGFP